MMMLLLFPLAEKNQPKCCPMMQTCPCMSGKIPAARESKKKQKGSCQGCCGCNTILTVNAPAYLPTQPMALKAVFSSPLLTRLPFYRMGELPDHRDTDWKPPKSDPPTRTS